LGAEVRATGAPNADAFPPSPARVVETFASGHGWTQAATGTITDDTSDYAVGAQSLRTVTNAAGAQSKLRKTGYAAVDYTRSSVRVVLKITGLAHITACTLYLGSGGFAAFLTAPLNSGQWNSTTPTDQSNSVVRDGEWLTVTLPWSAFTVGGGSPSRASITDYQVLVQDDAAGAVTVRVNEIAAVPEPPVAAGAGGIVTFWFDDGWLTQYTVAKPKLDQYGWGGTLPVISDLIGTDAAYCTLPQLQQMERTSGWEIACHAYTAAHHSLTNAYVDLSITDCETDWRLQRAWLLDNGLGRGRDILAYPNGKWSVGANSMEDRARRYFAVARTIDLVTPSAMPPQSPYRLRSAGYAYNTTTLVALKALVDKCVASGGWLNFTFHKLVASPVLSYEYLTSDFNSLVDYVAASGLPVMTASNALRAMTAAGALTADGPATRASLRTLTNLDTRYQPQAPGLVVPMLTDSTIPNTVANTTSNVIRLVRVVIPRTGTLHDVSVFVGTASGNLIAVVYDTGDALAGSRTLLWQSASTAAAGASVWQVVGDPALAVTAGQQLDLGIMADNGTVTLGKGLAPTAAGAVQLPTSFVPVAGGALPKLTASMSPGSFAPASAVVEASVSTSGSLWQVIARVT
jgi:hypothetical protein